LEQVLTLADELVAGDIQRQHSDAVSGGVGLTPREIEILRLVAGGKSNAEIAAVLVISIRTAERHLANIYSKLGTGGAVARARATSYAHTHGVVTPVST
jgi:DNA-binding CsgD family transcriptional regulator